MTRIRADRLLVARGLAETRALAQAAIVAGGVRADGEVVVRAAQLVAEDAELALDPPHPWVSRGGLKLAHALTAFGVDPAGTICLDVGASTGGFTDVLLARGATHVTAVDVGRAQLHPRLRGDHRVRVLEGRDARTLTAADLPGPPGLVVCDASFIGLAKVLAVPLALAAPDAALIALVKPQYEAGPGVTVRTPEAARAVAEAAARGLDGLAGFTLRALVDSPVRGGDGQIEFLLLARRP
ncbi:MAG: TlyA family RNA methyltransferase [Hyphomonadaceae bacterium]|nr:TlyA family RNA methyltransferase [Hyphomonadaceae bacterium]